ncbi:MAG: DUF4256 domain-containing protein, partial [Bacteroidales bacterium]|nr:DUF4256 domain-containing protein [Bacteroidales bacterium]
MSEIQRDELIVKLKDRFENNMRRHEGLIWPDIQARLNRSGDKLFTLFEMDRTGGEPDVTSRNEEKDEYVFTDCSPESPAGRRSLCYDRRGMESRKENRPGGNAIDMAADMGM